MTEDCLWPFDNGHKQMSGKHFVMSPFRQNRPGGREVTRCAANSPHPASAGLYPWLSALIRGPSL